MFCWGLEEKINPAYIWDNTDFSTTRHKFNLCCESADTTRVRVVISRLQFLPFSPVAYIILPPTFCLLPLHPLTLTNEASIGKIW